MSAIGILASVWKGAIVPLEVMSDKPGLFYLGSNTPSDPRLRESETTWFKRRDAEKALKTNDWTQFLPLEAIPLTNGNWTIGAIHIDDASKVIDLVIACDQEWPSEAEAQDALNQNQWVRSNPRGLPETDLPAQHHQLLERHCGL